MGYEYKYPDGRGVHYSRPHMIHGDQGPHDSHTTYYNVACQARLPIPPGFTAPPYGDPQGKPGLLEMILLSHNTSNVIYNLYTHLHIT